MSEPNRVVESLDMISQGLLGFIHPLEDSLRTMMGVVVGLDHQLKNLDAKLSSLETRLGDLESKVQELTVEVKGYPYPEVISMEQIVQELTNQKIPRYGEEKPGA